MSLAEFGKAIGNESRVAMLHALMGGRALSATELAWYAGITSQTASSHLGELMNAGLLYRRKCGRFHYYEISDESVASFIERLACDVPARNGHGPRRAVGHELKKARFCYDHLAGELGVAISKSLMEMGALILDRDSYRLPQHEHRVYREIGVDFAEVRAKRRRLCPRCVDWTERLPHVAGALGAAIARKLVERRFIVRSRNDQSVAITRSGRSFLVQNFGFGRAFFTEAPDIAKP